MELRMPLNFWFSCFHLPKTEIGIVLIPCPVFLGCWGSKALYHWATRSYPIARLTCSSLSASVPQVLGVEVCATTAAWRFQVWQQGLAVRDDWAKLVVILSESLRCWRFQACAPVPSNVCCVVSVCGAGNWAQGLMRARKVLCHWPASWHASPPLYLDA